MSTSDRLTVIGIGAAVVMAVTGGGCSTNARIVDVRTELGHASAGKARRRLRRRGADAGVARRASPAVAHPRSRPGSRLLGPHAVERTNLSGQHTATDRGVPRGPRPRMGIPRDRGACFARGHRRKAGWSPVHRLYWTGNSGPPGPAPNDTGSRLTAAFRSRSCSVPQRGQVQRRTPRRRSFESGSRSPQALHRLDAGNCLSATVNSMPAFGGLVLELPPELVDAQLGYGA